MPHFSNTDQPENILGTAGADVFEILTGSGAGNDVFFGMAGNDTASGGTGDDFLDGGTGSNALYGGAGDDVVSASDPSLLNANVLHGGSGDDVVITTGGHDALFGDAGIDTAEFNFVTVGITVDLGASIDVIDLGVFGSVAISGFENVTTWSGADSVTGSDQANLIVTNGGNDTVRGLGGDDVITGGGGEDHIYGGSGNDALVGNAGRDTLFGGAGSDVFAFLKVTDSRAGHGDQIGDFVSGVDVFNMEGFLDLTGHVSPGPRICHFSFIGAAHFSGHADEVRFQNGVLQADTDQNGIADFSIKLLGVAALADIDFMFS